MEKHCILNSNKYSKVPMSKLDKKYARMLREKTCKALLIAIKCPKSKERQLNIRDNMTHYLKYSEINISIKSIQCQEKSEIDFSWDLKIDLKTHVNNEYATIVNITKKQKTIMVVVKCFLLTSKYFIMLCNGPVDVIMHRYMERVNNEVDGLSSKWKIKKRVVTPYAWDVHVGNCQHGNYQYLQRILDKNKWNI